MTVTAASLAQQREQWEGEFLAMESQLTVFELFVLLQVATGGQGLGPLEPMWPYLDQPMCEAPFAMASSALWELAQQRRLQEIGLLALYRDADGAPQFALTDKGQAAVEHWLEALQDLGFQHETLAVA